MSNNPENPAAIAELSRIFGDEKRIISSRKHYSIELRALIPLPNRCATSLLLSDIVYDPKTGFTCIEDRDGVYHEYTMKASAASVVQFVATHPCYKDWRYIHIMFSDGSTIKIMARTKTVIQKELGWLPKTTEDTNDH